VTSSLYVSTFAPTLGTGRALRTYTCAKALAMLGPVDFAYVPHGGAPASEYEAIEGMELHRIEPSRGLRRAAFYLSKRAAGVPDEFARGAHPELLRVTRRLLAERSYERVVAGDVSAAAVLQPLSSEHPIVYNSHNVTGAYEQAGASAGRRSQTRAAAFERKLLSSAAETWMVSRLDLETAERLAPSARLRYVPNVADVSAIEPARPGPRGRGILMVGDFLYPPNQLGRSFMVEEVMPRVWQSAPEARLTLVGRGLDGWHAPDARIVLAGFVEDLAAAYGRSACVVVPITVGGGTPLKFVEALAYGVPVVATPFAARGLQAAPGEHYREGTDADSFAEGVLEVLRDGATQMAARARTLAEREYSVEALARLLAA
jgi:glycosyltransferase involved in cell wall biosynthesis